MTSFPPPPPPTPGYPNGWPPPAPPAAPAASPLTSDQHGAVWRTSLGTIAWVVAALTIGYMLPWAIAVSRGNANAWGVFWVNLLTGWTVIGWIAGLVMAFRTHSVTLA